MAGIKIKIVSNPYQEIVRFFRWDNGWQEITTSTNPNSALHSTKIVNGFFPFKAEEIIDILAKEFGGGDKIELHFEGADDEWQELLAICTEGPRANTYEAMRDERYLSNARDVLPEIVEVFREIQGLIDEAVSERTKVSEQIRKFTDVSSDIIPLCVLGTYSAGKSTLINALIGMEILPSGDGPVTARIFQIKRSKDRDRAMVQFFCGNRRFLLRFDLDGLMENKELTGDPLYDKIATKVAGSTAGMAAHMNNTLKVLNSYHADEDDRTISDLIRIEVPFSDTDPWPHDREFVIFDTPGPNSATNDDHTRVLKQAMEGLSNGLPIFVAEYTTLDTKDNENLSNEIKEIPAIDERFAMIVVNKADSADLPKGGFDDERVSDIMRQFIPSRLYGQGIYFVSSILGLGSKNSGEFISDNYAERFEDQQRKYTDPTSRFYKTLYRYDILPGQISRRTNRESEACKDLLLANSGLFCIENEIRLFAERYSAYNKCSRSESLLQEIVGITEEEIAGKKTDLEQKKAQREAELEEDKRALIDQLEACKEHAKEDASASYRETIDKSVSAKQWETSLDALQARQNAITEEKREGLEYSKRSIAAAKAFDSIAPNFFNRLGDSIKGSQVNEQKDSEPRPTGGLADVGKGLCDDITDAFHKRSDAKAAEKTADKDAADQLFNEVINHYDECVEQIAQTIDELSQSYWKNCAERSRDALYRIATSSDNPLSEKKRQEVGDIILNYHGLALDKTKDPIFSKADFTELKLMDRVIFKSDKLLLRKVEDKFNREISRYFCEARAETEREHTYGFTEWLNELLGQITSNITDYNPVLHGHVEDINRQTAEINALEAKLETLNNRKEYIARVINWKE